MTDAIEAENSLIFFCLCACVGNPSVILIDEFSTGVDAKMKRDIWITLKNVAIGKAVVITTRELALRKTVLQVGDLIRLFCRLNGGGLDSGQQGWHHS